jgi:hypothetical protein
MLYPLVFFASVGVSFLLWLIHITKQLCVLCLPAASLWQAGAVCGS